MNRMELKAAQAKSMAELMASGLLFIIDSHKPNGFGGKWTDGKTTVQLCKNTANGKIFAMVDGKWQPAEPTKNQKDAMMIAWWKLLEALENADFERHCLYMDTWNSAVPQTQKKQPMAMATRRKPYQSQRRKFLSEEHNA